MKGTTYEATIQDGRVVLPEGAHIPEHTRVYVVVPEADEPAPARMMSPRLAHREDADDFLMQVEREGDDARL
jgi:hypothetical protein